MLYKKDIIEDNRKLKAENKKLQEEIERLNNIINRVITDMGDTLENNRFYKEQCIDDSLLSFWIDILKDSDKK